MYGLIGYPLGHSFSAEFFNNKFSREGIKEEYCLFPITDISLVTQLINENKDLKGFNVTIPYKQQIIPFLSSISDEASEIGAVNVVKIDRDGNGIKLSGYNSDAIGFKNSLMPFLRPEMKKALILGTGGASKAVEYVLESLGIQTRKVSRKGNGDTLGYKDLTEKIMADHHIIVNTTPLGMWPNVDDCPDIPYHYLTPEHICYDVVYNPEITMFMRRSAEYGATVKNGLEMLHLQALAAWDIWNSRE